MQVKIVWSPVLETGSGLSVSEELPKASVESDAQSQQPRLIQKSNMRLVAHMAGHTVEMDARPPVGGNNGATPKHLLLSAICGCTAMDVVSLLRKYKQELTELVVEADAEASSGHPSVFEDIYLKFYAAGQIEKEKLHEAIHLSQTKYCGVSAMVSKVSRLWWQAFLNGEKIGEGRGQFDDFKPV